MREFQGSGILLKWKTLTINIDKYDNKYELICLDIFFFICLCFHTFAQIGSNVRFLPLPKFLKWKKKRKQTEMLFFWQSRKKHVDLVLKVYYYGCDLMYVNLSASSCHYFQALNFE